MMDLPFTDFFLQYLDVSGELLVALNRDGLIAHANSRTCEILGYPSKDIIGKNWFQTYLPEHAKPKALETFRVLHSGQDKDSNRHTNSVITRSGKERLISWQNMVTHDDQGKISGTLSIGEDITDITETENALRKSEYKYRQLVEHAPHGIEEIDLTGTITYANPAYYGFFGYTKEEFIGKKIWDLVAGNPHPAGAG